MLNEVDLNIYDMIEIMSFLEPNPPITKALDKWGTVGTDQKGHMLGWCSAQPTKGKGAYSRSKGNESTRIMYNRFLNPGGLLWMAEALGAKEQTLRQAVDAAIAAEKTDYRNRCKAFREVISFDDIVDLINEPQGWLIDERIVPLLDFDDETGQPYLKEECEDALEEILSVYF